MSIVIYGRDACDWCDRALELCHQHSLDVTYKSLDDRFSGDTNRAELFSLAEQQNLNIKTVPQIWWNGNYIGGFNDLATEIENTRNFGDGKI